MNAFASPPIALWLIAIVATAAELCRVEVAQLSRRLGSVHAAHDELPLHHGSDV